MLKQLLLALAATGLLAGAPALAATQADTKKAQAKATKTSAKKADKAVKKTAKAEGPLVVTVKPPSGQWEGNPPPAEGWVWRAGFHDWDGERFVWKKGEWILDQPGKDFRQHQWVEAGEGKWKLVGGEWVPEKSS